MNRILIAMLLAGMSMQALAAPQEKADICHFDMDYGVWKLIRISDNAVDKHFTNHDDGLPGGETLGTDTNLDEDCVPAPLPDYCLGVTCTGDRVCNPNTGGCEDP